MPWVALQGLVVGTADGRWVGSDPPEPVDEDEALATLGRRYLEGYGPAGDRGPGGLVGPAAGQGAARAGAGRAGRHGSPGRAAGVRAAGGVRPGDAGLGDARAAGARPETRATCCRAAGMLRPVVLAGERVVGTWRGAGARVRLVRARAAGRGAGGRGGRREAVPGVLRQIVEQSASCRRCLRRPRPGPPGRRLLRHLRDRPGAGPRRRAHQRGRRPDRGRRAAAVADRPGAVGPRGRIRGPGPARMAGRRRRGRLPAGLLRGGRPDRRGRGHGRGHRLGPGGGRPAVAGGQRRAPDRPLGGGHRAGVRRHRPAGRRRRLGLGRPRRGRRWPWWRAWATPPTRCWPSA